MLQLPSGSKATLLCQLRCLTRLQLRDLIMTLAWLPVRDHSLFSGGTMQVRIDSIGGSAFRG